MLTLKEYTELVIALIEEIIGDCDISADLTTGTIKVKDKEGTGFSINLANMYKNYIKNPKGDLKGTLNNIIKGSLKFDETFEKMDTWECVKDFIRPLIKPKDFKLSKAVFEDYTENLSIYYVIDRDNAVIYVTESMLEKWGKPLDAVRFEGLKNLSKLNKNIIVDEQENSGLFVVVCEELIYTATLMLILDLETIQKRVEGRLCIGIPNRGVLLLFGEDNVNYNALKDKIHRLYQEDGYALYDGVMVYDGN